MGLDEVSVLRDPEVNATGEASLRVRAVGAKCSGSYEGERTCPAMPAQMQQQQEHPGREEQAALPRARGHLGKAKGTEDT